MAESEEEVKSLLMKVKEESEKVGLGVWIYLWAFYFVPLIYISVFVSSTKEARIYNGLNTRKDAQHHSLLEKCKSKPQ